MFSATQTRDKTQQRIHVNLNTFFLNVLSLKYRQQEIRIIYYVNFDLFL